MIRIREAIDGDAEEVRDVFKACYGDKYTYREYYDLHFLRRLILGSDALVLVAEEATSDDDTGRIVGTASVFLEVGAYSDLTGEFGRLAVRPDARGQHVGTALMEGRLARVRDRLHVGIVDARVAHPYSLRISQSHGFAVVGFLPLRHLFDRRESVCLLGQWFGEALALRCNNPRIIPEVYPVAGLALTSAGLPVDPVVDGDATPFPHETDFDVETLTTTGYSTLLRIERGRTRQRKVFGPMRLHYGYFKLSASHADYLIARDRGQVAGAVGFLHDEQERTVRIFELITPDDRAIHFMLHELERRCREQWDVTYMEIDVNASAPRLQRTLLEIGFTPAAYIPAMVFQDVERLDVVRMVRLLVPPDLGDIVMTPEATAMADIVMAPLRHLHLGEHIDDAVRRAAIFQGMSPEQIVRVLALCRVRRFTAGHNLISQGASDHALFIILDGRVEIRDETTGSPRAVARAAAGDVVGEMGVLGAAPHAATVVALDAVETVAIDRQALLTLIRRRTDIGLLLYRNLAMGLARKLRQSDGAG